MSFPTILDTKQAATLLGVSPVTLRALAKRGRIATVQLGQRKRYLETDLVAWVHASRSCATRL